MFDELKDVAILEKRITDLSDALAHLGKGTSLRELLLIIKRPGWTTPAEFKFSMAMLDAVQNHVQAIERIGQQLVEAGELVGRKQ